MRELWFMSKVTSTIMFLFAMLILVDTAFEHFPLVSTALTLGFGLLVAFPYWFRRLKNAPPGCST